MPIPPHIVGAGVAAFDLHDPAVPVAEICFDSLLDLSSASQEFRRRVVFETADLRLEVRVGVGPLQRDLELRFTPPCRSQVVVLQVDQNRVVETTRPGRATVEDFCSGLTSLLVRRDLGDGGAVRTAWVIL